MATVQVTEYSPSGIYEQNRVPVACHFDHDDGVDSTTISVVLTDPHGNTHNPVTNGTFDTSNGFHGILSEDETGFDLVIEHSGFLAGIWTVEASADSLNGSEDGTLSWTFTVIGVLPAVVRKIIEILEGTVDTSLSNRLIPSNRFKHVNFQKDLLGTLASSGKVCPFVIEWVGYSDDGSLPSFISGNYVQEAHEVRITFFYSFNPNDILDLEIHIMDNDFLVRRAMIWPQNFNLVNGWTNCRLLATNQSSSEMEDGSLQIEVSYLFQISTRERQ